MQRGRGLKSAGSPRRPCAGCEKFQGFSQWPHVRRSESNLPRAASETTTQDTGDPSAAQRPNAASSPATGSRRRPNWRASEVSMMSVRRALDELERAGKIQRKQGLGTFVAESRIASDPTRPGELLDTLIDEGGGLPGLTTSRRAAAQPGARDRPGAPRARRSLYRFIGSATESPTNTPSRRSRSTRQAAGRPSNSR